jgi:acyl-CoA synthetase (AMP-forming)/AMP-acid ligase II
MYWIRDRFRQFSQKLIVVNESGSVTYAEFLQKIDDWHVALQKWNIRAGDRIGLVAEYHIDAVALLLALMESACIVIPLSEEDHVQFEERLNIVCATKLISVSNHESIHSDSVVCQDIRQQKQAHPLLLSMLSNRQAGFVIFTSGSTGKSKAVLLEYRRMISKYEDKMGKSFRTLLFLKLDHIGGLNTLFSVILNGGTIVASPSRQAKEICHCIEKFKVELLPTTPSFLTMLLMSNTYKSYDLSSLQIITYGTEVMPNSTLAGLNRILPEVILKQTYGLSELGIFSTKSKDSQSNWMKIGGKGIDIKVKDEALWIKSDQAMLGYLNAESPFDEEGWYNTGDKVEVDGEYFRIQGRDSEIINVAGEKVFPAEIESYLLTLDNVKEVVVRGKYSPVTGQIIWAEFVLEKDEEITTFKKRTIEKCKAHFPAFKVPGFITITSLENVVGSRFKKNRNCIARSHN